MKEKVKFPIEIKMERKNFLIDFLTEKELEMSFEDLALFFEKETADNNEFSLFDNGQEIIPPLLRGKVFLVSVTPFYAVIFRFKKGPKCWSFDLDGSYKSKLKNGEFLILRKISKG